MRCHLKTFRVLWLILALLMSLHCISCTDTSNTPPDGGENNGESPSPDENAPSDGEQEKKVYTFDDATAEDFAVSYEIVSGVTEYHPKEQVQVRVTMTNLTDKDFSYIAYRQNPLLSIALYCETEEGVFLVDTPPEPDQEYEEGEYVFAAGESAQLWGYFDIQRNAPAGSYHIEVVSKAGSYVFENVLTIVE